MSGSISRQFLSAGAGRVLGPRSGRGAGMPGLVASEDDAGDGMGDVNLVEMDESDARVVEELDQQREREEQRAHNRRRDRAVGGDPVGQRRPKRARFRNRKNKSPVYELFTISGEEGARNGKCKLCGKVVALSINSSNALRHARGQHDSLWMEVERALTQEGQGYVAAVAVIKAAVSAQRPTRDIRSLMPRLSTAKSVVNTSPPSPLPSRPHPRLTRS